MALWKWTGCSYEKVPWHCMSTGNLKAMLYGTGDSLNTVTDVNPEGYMRFCINYAYKKVEPHIMIGMDEPEKFGKETLEKPFRKVFRGNHATSLVNGIMAREYPETYFADVQSDNQSTVFYNRGIDTSFFFSKKSMFVAIHLMLYMGFKHIGFTGCDFGGDYFYNEKLNDMCKMALEEEFTFMKWFVPVCETQGIKLENHSPVSRLKELIKDKV